MVPGVPEYPSPGRVDRRCAGKLYTENVCKSQGGGRMDSEEAIFSAKQMERSEFKDKRLITGYHTTRA
eukprot:1235080-Rhodomonas_salina.1